MSVDFCVVLWCDHRGCKRSITLPTADLARAERIAARRRWTKRLRRANVFGNYCPRHGRSVR